MKKNSNKLSSNNYQQLYEELQEKYLDKEKENKHLKVLLKLRDKEIISLKCKIKNIDNNNEDSKKNNYSNTSSINNSNREISTKYLEYLIKTEIENIQKEQISFRNKILTLENYELQFLAPKLTTANSKGYHFSSGNLLNNSLNKSIDGIYLNVKKNDKLKPNYNNRNNRLHKPKRNNINNYHGIFNESTDFDNDNIFSVNASFNKTLSKQ